MHVVIDFNKQALHDEWLNIFGENGRNVTCVTASELKSLGGQDIRRINWGGAVYNQASSIPCSAEDYHGESSDIYLARLAVDARSWGSPESSYRSVVGASTKDFEGAVLDLKDRLKDRIVRYSWPVLFTTDENNIAGNAEFSKNELLERGYVQADTNKLQYLF